MYDVELVSDDDNNDQTTSDPLGGPGGPRVAMDLMEPKTHRTSGSCLYESASQVPDLLG